MRLRPSLVQRLDRDENCSGNADCGHTVSLDYAYSQNEPGRLVKCSNEILANHGFGESNSFRAGGWQLGTKLAKALLEINFSLESSKTDGKVWIPQWGENSNLVQMVLKLHPPASTLIKLFKENVKAGKGHFVTGLHLETADTIFLNRKGALKKLKNMPGKIIFKLIGPIFP